jgi:HSP20 family protein
MGHQRWDPLRDLLDLQERINRLLEESLARGLAPDVGLPTPAWHPLADVCETGDAVVVQIELPGVTRAEIDIRAEPHAVTVKGQRRSTVAARAEAYLRMERSHGPFQRTFHLSEEIDPAEVTAELVDGVLVVRMPKANPHRVRRVVATRAEQS